MKSAKPDCGSITDSEITKKSRSRLTIFLRMSKSARESGANGKDVPLHKQLKAAISVRDFVSHYVTLSPSGSGLCPFHSDHVESFSVHDGQNYWKCFASEKSGSIIDFWIYYRDCDFRTAVTQLANKLL